MQQLSRRPASRLRAADIQSYHAAEQLTEAVIYLMVVFSPWAFGSTQRWSMWVMSCGGYLLGVLLLVKLGIRFVRGYQPARWVASGMVSNLADREAGVPDGLCAEQGRGSPRSARGVVWAVALTNGLLLLYCLVSALNARASFDERSLTFVYRDCVGWLPHSLDASATWFAFWTYLGLTCFFWALRDWLTGKSSGEERAEWQYSLFGDHELGKAAVSRSPMPARLRRLLWVLALNGGLLGTEAIIQRAADSPRLLFLVQPRIHQTAEGQFGPYAYRSNAAQYFNLLWPVCLGFWWTLNRASLRERSATGRRGGGGHPTHHALLAAAAVMAACPIVSTSRAGAIISILIAVLSAAAFSAARWTARARAPHHSRGARDPTLRRPTSRPLMAFFLGAMTLGFALGWQQLAPRLNQLDDGFAGREQMYAAAQPMARDYPVFGTGPGSFETVSQLYPRPDIFWPAQLHNDWLETRITFGWVGSGLIALAFFGVLLRWWAPGGIHGGRRFVILVWLALAGCLLHARFDFPFQVHSTLFLFVLLCAILFTLSRRPVARQ